MARVSGFCAILRDEKRVAREKRRVRIKIIF
jgi:hypothetical protein